MASAWLHLFRSASTARAVPTRAHRFTPFKVLAPFILATGAPAILTPAQILPASRRPGKGSRRNLRARPTPQARQHRMQPTRYATLMVLLRLLPSASPEPAFPTLAHHFICFSATDGPAPRRDPAILTRSCRSRAGAARTASIEPGNTRVASGVIVCVSDRRRGLYSVDTDACARQRIPWRQNSAAAAAAELAMLGAERSRGPSRTCSGRRLPRGRSRGRTRRLPRPYNALA